MSKSDRIEKRIARYDAWRKRKNVTMPLMGLAWEPDVQPLPAMLDELEPGQEVTPDQIRPEMFLDWIESCYQQDCLLHGDVIQGFAPAFGIPWIEAIAGCPVLAHPGSLWAGPCLESYANRPRLRLDPENPWLLKLVEFTRILVDLAGGRFPITLPLTRGPLDTLAAMRGPERMALDCYDHRGEVYQILDELAELWIAACQAVLPCIPPFHGGYASRMRMWAPGPAVTPQNDVSSMLSPGMYKDLVLQSDRKIVRAFPYHSYHLHDTEQHQIDNLLQLEELTCIQLFLQPSSGGPPVDKVLPVVRRALSVKPVILGTEDVETAERCLAELPAAGLCLLLCTEGDGPIPSDHRLWLERRAV